MLKRTISDQGIFKQRLIIAFFLALIFLLDTSSMINQSKVYDEGDYHLDFGRGMLQGRPFNLYTACGISPFSALNVLSGDLFQRIFHGRIRISEKRWLFFCRLPTVLFSLGLWFILFVWARGVLGMPAAILSSIFFSFCPNIIAHSGLATTDLYATFFIFFATFMFVRFLKQPSLKRYLFSAFVTGLAFVAKHTAFILMPVFFLLFLSKTFSKNIKKCLKSVSLGTLGYLVIIIFVINAAYLFKDTFQPLGNLQLKSRALSSLQAHLPGKIPLPLPKVYLLSLDWGIFNNETCGGHGPIYLLGKLKKCGWPYYYLVALLFKVPLAAIILFIAAVVLSLMNHRLSALDKSSIIALPFIFLLITPFFKNQVGVRNALIIFPFCYLIIGSVAADKGLTHRRSVKLSLFFLTSWYILSSLSFFPHYLAYFNELIGSRQNMYKYLADSNVDWGQNEYYLEQFMHEHKGKVLYLNPRKPLKEELVVISINELVGLFCPPSYYSWLRNNYKPVGHIGYSYLVYDTRDK